MLKDSHDGTVSCASESILYTEASVPFNPSTQAGLTQLDSDSAICILIGEGIRENHLSIDRL